MWFTVVARVFGEKFYIYEDTKQKKMEKFQDCEKLWAHGEHDLLVHTLKKGNLALFLADDKAFLMVNNL